LIEILVADDFGRDIARGDRALVAALPRQRPALEAFRRTQRERFVVAEIGAVEAKGLAGGDSISGAFAVSFAFATSHGDQRRAVLRIDVESERACTCNREREVRRIDLDDLTGVDTPHLNLQTALHEFHLLDAVIEIEYRDVRLRAEAQRGIGHLHFAA
jgi:hypothetical protein